MAEPIDLFGDTEAKRLERGEQAHQAHLRNRTVVTDVRVQPKLIWSLHPLSDATLTSLIEADGSSPFKVLSVMQLDRRALKLAGAPAWAQACALVMVEVRALFAER